MSTTQSESDLRNQLQYWVVASNYKYSGSVLHIPSSTSTRDEPEPACDRYNYSDFIIKDVAVYPPGFRPVCQRCLERWDDG